MRTFEVLILDRTQKREEEWISYRLFGVGVGVRLSFWLGVRFGLSLARVAHLSRCWLRP